MQTVLQHEPLPEERLVRMLAHMLRHQPERYGVTVSSRGWAEADDVLRVIRRRRRGLGLSNSFGQCDLERFVANQGDRFELEQGLIRARYGHSLAVTVGVRAEPPHVLFHGTADYYLNAIRLLGIKSYTRTFVHTTSDTRYAREVAEATDGTPTILRIRARAAARAGIVFRRASRHVWLASTIPVHFLESEFRS